MKICFVLLFLTLSLSAVAESSWLNFFQANQSLKTTYTDYHHGTSEWFSDPAYGNSLKKVSPKDDSTFESSICGTTFYPAHPLATTKSYHEALYQNLDLAKMTGHSYYCQIPGYRGLRCVRAGSFKFTVISDTFFDDCGNHFRAYWVAAYYHSDDPRKTDETMGTLLSRGRNIIKDTTSLFDKDYLPTNTHQVYKDDFIYFTPLFKGDKKKIKKAVKKSKKTFGLQRDTNLFK